MNEAFFYAVPMPELLAKGDTYRRAENFFRGTNLLEAVTNKTYRAVEIGEFNGRDYIAALNIRRVGKSKYTVVTVESKGKFWSVPELIITHVKTERDINRVIKELKEQYSPHWLRTVRREPIPELEVDFRKNTVSGIQELLDSAQEILYFDIPRLN